MDKNLAEVIFVIDESGSMYGLEKDTIVGFNSTIEKQNKLDGKCLISTLFFNSRSRVIHDRVDIQKIKMMKDGDYNPNGSTALIDAIGDGIKHIEMVHRYIRKEDISAKTMFIITLMEWRIHPANIH